MIPKVLPKKPRKPLPDDALTITNAARYLGVTKRVIDSAHVSGLLSTCTPDINWRRFRRRDLDEYAAKHLTKVATK